jgi:hypothetical protein
MVKVNKKNQNDKYLRIEGILLSLKPMLCSSSRYKLHNLTF